LLLAAIAAGGGVVQAGPPPLPDDFLEYLGSWDADDADWLVATATDPRAAVVAATPDSQPVAPAGTAQSTSRSTTTPRGTTTSPAPGTEPQP
jgi:hypothetical protein